MTSIPEKKFPEAFLSIDIGLLVHKKVDVGWLMTKNIGLFIGAYDGKVCIHSHKGGGVYNQDLYDGQYLYVDQNRIVFTKGEGVVFEGVLVHEGKWKAYIEPPEKKNTDSEVSTKELISVRKE